MLPSSRRPGSTAPEWLATCLSVFCTPLMPPIADTVPEAQPFHMYLTKLAKPYEAFLGSRTAAVEVKRVMTEAQRMMPENSGGNRSGELTEAVRRML